jgi:hypothetical protein
VRRAMASNPVCEIHPADPAFGGAECGFHVILEEPLEADLCSPFQGAHINCRGLDLSLSHHLKLRLVSAYRLRCCEVSCLSYYKYVSSIYYGIVQKLSHTTID